MKRVGNRAEADRAQDASEPESQVDEPTSSSIRSPASRATCASRPKSTAASVTQRVVVGHDVPRHRDHPAGTRSARRLGLRPAHLRRLHHGARDRLGARGRERARLELPPNAQLLRNLIMAAQCVQDHIVHFYHLHALDWVDVVSALSADPAKTSALAEVDLGLAAVERRSTSPAVRDRHQERSSSAASSGRSPTATGATRRTGCRPKRT